MHIGTRLSVAAVCPASVYLTDQKPDALHQRVDSEARLFFRRAILDVHVAKSLLDYYERLVAHFPWKLDDLHCSALHELPRFFKGHVNQTNLKGRKLENMKRVRAVWVEWDGDGDPPAFPLAPLITVETSPGHFHLYWFVESISLKDFDRLMRVLVDRFGSDPNAKDVTRVLRLAGFFNMKRVPHQVELKNFEAARYTREQMFEKFPYVIEGDEPAQGGELVEPQSVDLKRL